jgi:phage gp45-like
MTELEVAISKLWRRVQTLIGRGRISAPALDNGNVQMLQIVLGAGYDGGEIRDNTPRLAEYGFTSSPALPDVGPDGKFKYGCDAIALFVAGDRSNGVIIATGDQRYRLRNLSPGEVALYDDLGQTVKLSRTGIKITSPQLVEIEAPKVHVNAGEVARIEGQKVQVHATQELALDCGGNGVIWTPIAVQTYQDGVPVTSHSAPTPPEIPS